MEFVQHGIVAWLIIGAVAGWLAGLLVKGGGFGLLVDVLVGIVGAVIGGWLFGVLPPRAVAVIAGVLMAFPGLVWLMVSAHGGVRVPRAALEAPLALDPSPATGD